MTRGAEFSSSVQNSHQPVNFPLAVWCSPLLAKPVHPALLYFVLHSLPCRVRCVPPVPTRTPLPRTGEPMPSSRRRASTSVSRRLPLVRTVRLVRPPTNSSQPPPLTLRCQFTAHGCARVQRPTRISYSVSPLLARTRAC